MTVFLTVLYLSLSDESISGGAYSLKFDPLRGQSGGGEANAGRKTFTPYFSCLQIFFCAIAESFQRHFAFADSPN